MRTASNVVMCLLLGASILTAQHITVLATGPGRIKVDDGQICWWLAHSTDVTSPQARIFDRSGNLLAALAVLQPVQGARSVSIYDVAVRQKAMIAVAAVYSKEDGSRPAAALLYFDFKGKLLSFFVLDPSRGVLRLAIDERLHVWTLTTWSGGKDPSEVPMVIEYDARGRVVRELLPRDQFPLHAEAIEESSGNGFASFGYQSDTVWFWLPGSTDLVTIRTDSGRVTRVSTGIPTVIGGAAPRSLDRQPSGNLVAEVVQKRLEDGALVSAVYLWSPETGQWTQLTPSACPDHVFVGVSGHDMLLVSFAGGAPEICAAPLSRP